MQRALGQQPPREDREDAKRHLEQRDAPPHEDVLPAPGDLGPPAVCRVRPPASGHDHGGARYPEPVPCPFPDEDAEDDGAKGDRVFEARAVVHGLGMLVDGEEGHRDEGQRDLPTAFLDPGVDCGSEAEAVAEMQDKAR